MIQIFQGFGVILSGTFGLIVFGIIVDLVVRAFTGKNP